MKFRSVTKFRCQCHNPSRTLSAAAVKSHHRAAQQHRDNVNKRRKQLGEPMLDVIVPRPVPLIDTTRRRAEARV